MGCAWSKALTLRKISSTTYSWDLQYYTANYERGIAASCHKEEDKLQTGAETQPVTLRQHACRD